MTDADRFVKNIIGETLYKKCELCGANIRQAVEHPIGTLGIKYHVCATCKKNGGT